MGARDLLYPVLPAAGGDDIAREFAFGPPEFDRVRRLIHRRAGIHLNESKHNMVYGRLSRRLRATGSTSFCAYLDRLETDAAFAEREGQLFVNALTTNLTSFFRESHHFPLLAEYLRGCDRRAPLRLWCAAASTGEEAYSIAMTMTEVLGAEPSARLLATDIDTQVLAIGERGVYGLDSAHRCGEARRKRFFLRGRGANEGLVRVRPELARRVEFAVLNLRDDDWPALRSFAPLVDAVFCRNVMIYFDRATRHAVLGRIAQVLKPGGLLFAGHSESFTDCRQWFAPRGKTVYERLRP